jgi:hypothetical protein
MWLLMLEVVCKLAVLVLCCYDDETALLSTCWRVFTGLKGGFVEEGMASLNPAL